MKVVKVQDLQPDNRTDVIMKTIFGGEENSQVKFVRSPKQETSLKTLFTHIPTCCYLRFPLFLMRKKNYDPKRLYLLVRFLPQ